MAEREPVTQTVNATDARQNWSQLINDVFRGKTRVLVEKSGIAVAAVVSTSDLERLRLLDASERAGWAAVDRIRERNAGAAPNDVLRDVAGEVEAVRLAAHRKPSSPRRLNGTKRIGRAKPA